MTVTHRKRTQLPDEIQAVNEPGLKIQCDSCICDLTHSIRIKCADPVCEPGDGIDICPVCFCAGKEFKQHKRAHAYRVVELHSYPIFAEDWGADEELLLIEGIALQGIGNWQAVAEHVGTRTKDEVEQHYTEVYIDSPNWPQPRMDVEFNIDAATFQERKRRRLSSMNTVPSIPKPAPTSAPGMHEIATFLPGRLEFEHEIDNEAEDLIKDLEFGICLEYGGDQIDIDVKDNDVITRAKLEEDKRRGFSNDIDMPLAQLNGNYFANGIDHVKEAQVKTDPSEADGDAEEPTMPPPIETRESLDFKLTLLETYAQRVEKRVECKAIIFDRGLLEYKKMQAQEKKRAKEEKEIVNRLRPLAKLQTAEDYEAFVEGILYESTLRKRIQELQHYRRLGLSTATDIDRFDQDLAKRAHIKAQIAQGYPPEKLLRVVNPGSAGPDARRASVASFNDEGVPRAQTSNSSSLFRKQPAPLNLANSPSLHLLTPAEQTLCSSLRILPKPYLVMKETLVREYARRGGKLRRREARDLIKIDVNKSSKVWDFLVQAGFLKPPPPESDTPSVGAPSSQAPRGLPTAPPSMSSISPSAGGTALSPMKAPTIPFAPTWSSV